MEYGLIEARKRVKGYKCMPDALERLYQALRRRGGVI